MVNIDAYNVAIKLLTRREHSRLELLQKLQARGFTKTEIETLLDHLAEQNLQSDERFAAAYLAMRKQKGYGPVRIRQELHERGIAAAIINQLLNFQDDSWKDLAEQVRIKKFGKITPKDFQEKAKQLRFLQYRGFTNDQM